LAVATSETQLAPIVDCMAAAGVTVLNHSVLWDFDAPGDGSGIVNDAVDRAARKGIFWSQSAGNFAQTHWSGAWHSANNNQDDSLQFTETGTGTLVAVQSYVVNAGDRDRSIDVTIRWNDTWGTPSSAGSCDDFDLYLYDQPQRDVNHVIDRSINVQDCRTGATPHEHFRTQQLAPGTYYLEVFRFVPRDRSLIHNFDLISWNQRPAAVQYVTNPSSLAHPADSGSDGMVTVGAVPVNSLDVLEPFSSSGPTKDGRSKPDILAPDGIATTAGAFTGTSAAAPMTAGAAAIVKQANPAFTPAEVKSFILQNAVSAGGQLAKRLDLSQVVIRTVTGDSRVTCRPLSGYSASWCARQHDGSLLNIGGWGDTAVNEWVLPAGDYFHLAQLIVGDTVPDCSARCNMTVTVWGKNPEDVAPTELASETRTSASAQHWSFTLDSSKRWQIIRVQFVTGGSWQIPGEVQMVGSIEETNPILPGNVISDPRVTCAPIANYSVNWCASQRDGSLAMFGGGSPDTRINEWRLSPGTYFRLSQVVVGDTAHCNSCGNLSVTVYGKNPENPVPTILATETRGSDYDQRWTLNIPNGTSYQIIRIEFADGNSWQVPGEVQLIGSIEQTNPILPGNVISDPRVSCAPIMHYSADWCASQRDGSLAMFGGGSPDTRINEWRLPSGSYFALGQVVVGDTAHCNNCGLMVVTVYGSNPGDAAMTQLGQQTRSSDYDQRWVFNFDASGFHYQIIRVEFADGNSWQVPGEVQLVGVIQSQ